MDFTTFFILAGLLESVVNAFKWALQRRFNTWRIAALILGVVFALVYRVDLLTLVGMEPAYPYTHWVGQVVTGLLLSRGANVMADLATWVLRVSQGEAPSPLPFLDDTEEQPGGTV